MNEKIASSKESKDGLGASWINGFEMSTTQKLLRTVLCIAANGLQVYGLIWLYIYG